MKKGLKYTMAAVIGISAITPVVAAAATNTTVENVIVTKDGGNYSMNLNTYNSLLDAGKASGLDVQYIISSNGKTYSITEYNQAFDASAGNVGSALDKLSAAGTPVTITVEDAKFDLNGDLITEVSETFEVEDIT